MTKVTARPMPIAVSTLLEQPRNGQQPRNCEKMKLFISIALRAMVIMEAVLVIYSQPPALLSFRQTCAEHTA